MSAIQRERQPRHLTPDAPQSLDDLAATANREHELCEAASRSALEHAIAAGEALRAVRAVVGAGGWLAWLAENFAGSRTTANHYIRFATHREHLGSGMAIGEAREALRGLPDSSPRGLPCPDPTAQQEAVFLVREHHLSMSEAARRVGVHPSTVRKWVDPAAIKRRNAAAGRRRRAATAALAKVEREKAIRAAVRKAGAALSEAYSMSARMAKVLAQAEAEAATDEARVALAEATGHYHRMSDAITRALGVSP